MTAVPAGTMLARREASNHRYRVVDRALAVLELADMKTDHGRREEAAVLYRKGLECLSAALASLRGGHAPHEEQVRKKG